MHVRDFMTRKVDILGPDAPIAEAARRMRDRDIGSIPVAENDRLIGMVTDRDIVIRCVAEGRDGAVRDAMTSEILYCYDDQTAEEVARNMSEQKIRRLPVVDRDKRLVGIISLGDISKDHEGAAGEAMEEIVEAGRTAA